MSLPVEVRIRRDTRWWRHRFADWMSLSRPHAGRDGVEAYRESLIRSGAVKIAPNDNELFRLRNGSVSKFYVDHGDLLCEPAANASLVRALLHLIKSTFDPKRVVLVNVDSKSSPQLTGAIAAAGGFRQIIVLPEAVFLAENGTERRLRIPQKLYHDDRIVIVDDVLTPGDETAIKVAEIVRSEIERRMTGRSSGAHEFHLTVGLIREPDKAVGLVQEQGIREVHYLTTLDSVVGRSVYCR
jgi:orotate phosphoribosyltransferase